MKNSGIRKNPFIVAGKIPDELFCDRKKESATLVRELTNGNNLVLISSRRMGKTGLIQHCFDLPEIKNKYETFYIDILQTSSLAEFTYLLGKEIFSRLSSHSEQRLKKFMAFLHSITSSFGFDPFNGTPTFNLPLGDIRNPALTIDEIFNYLAQSETPVLVAIDEFQQIAKYKEKNIEAMLRSKIQQLENTNFIFAGSERHLLQQMFNDSARPFFKSASMMVLDPIRLEEYTHFAKDLFQQADKQLESEVVKHVYDAVAGNTFYLQKIFNLAYSRITEGEKCDVSIAEESVKEMLATYDTIYREMLAGLGESQKQLLIAIARDGEASAITSAEFIRRHALSSASSVQSATKRLLASNFITRSASTYRLQDPLLRIWLLKIY